MNFPRQFLLVAACCRWPLSEDAIADIRRLAGEAIDWANFMRIVKHQRVDALVHNAFAAAGIETPTPIAQQLASRSQRIARKNLLLVFESGRLQRMFDAAGIPVIELKGVALAQRAYGSFTLKHSKDIDLLVPPERAQAALDLLERDGYAVLFPAEKLSDRQRRCALQYGVEFVLRDRARKLDVDLRWHMTENSLLLAADDAWSHTQDVLISDSVNLRTLDDELLFAYLCTHGAGHGWFRLKWLADLNALIAQKSGGEIERLYGFAQARGCGFCAGQALLLCHRFLHLSLPARLLAELQASKRLKLLCAMAVDAMAGANAQVVIQDRPFGSTRLTLMRFFLGSGPAYFFAQCRITSVHVGDTIQLPLPQGLHFLYPILRFPLWLWRRISSGAVGASQTKAASSPRQR